MKKNKRKRWLKLSFLLITGAAIGDYIIVLATHGDSGRVNIASLGIPISMPETDQIKVMTINMAHGRSNGKSQLLQRKEAIKNNVTEIGRLVAKEKAQVVALQEADAPSWWSGNFSHVKTVARLGGMSAAIQGLNVEGLGLGYGTAIVTQLKAKSAHQVTFKKTVPTLSKGFVMASCEWPGDPTFVFDVVSLHLDFANANARKRQLAALREAIQKSAKPIIVMGDFNTDMSGDLLPAFLEKTQLKTWRVNDNSIVTFPLMGTRIDWILASPEFQIVEQRVLDEVLSDHKILTARIQRR